MHGTIQSMTNIEENSYIYRGPCDWYALLVTSGKERKATSWLKKRQLFPYWPRYKGQIRLNRHRRLTAWRSVIPGYLFLATPIGFANYQLIEGDRRQQGCPGVHSFMRDGDGFIIPFKIGHITEIERIELALNASTIAAQKNIPFKLDDMVCCKSIELWNVRGPVVAIDKKGNLDIEVDMFGRKVRWTLPASEVELM